MSKVPQQLRAAIPQIVARAQHVYNEWAQDEEGLDEELGEGGICDQIAEEVVGVLGALGIDSSTVWSEGVGENHVWAVARIAEGPGAGVWSIDIPPGVYETGGGYSWKKIPDVTLDEDDVVLTHESPDPSDFERYSESAY